MSLLRCQCDERMTFETKSALRNHQRTCPTHLAKLKKLFESRAARATTLSTHDRRTRRPAPPSPSLGQQPAPAASGSGAPFQDGSPRAFSPEFEFELPMLPQESEPAPDVSLSDSLFSQWVTHFRNKPPHSFQQLRQTLHGACVRHIVSHASSGISFLSHCHLRQVESRGFSFVSRSPSPHLRMPLASSVSLPGSRPMIPTRRCFLPTSMPPNLQKRNQTLVPTRTRRQ